MHECRAHNQKEHKALMDMHAKAKAGRKISPAEEKEFVARERRLHQHQATLAKVVWLAVPVFADLERGSAAACGDDVRVVDHEAGALEAVDVVDLRAEDELHAHLVDDHRNALVLEDVVLGLGLIEGERVLEA